MVSSDLGNLIQVFSYHSLNSSWSVVCLCEDQSLIKLDYEVLTHQCLVLNSSVLLEFLIFPKYLDSAVLAGCITYFLYT